MQVEDLRGDEATITFSIEELEMLCHAIAEACAGVPERGFRTRMSVTSEAAEDAHAQLNEILQNARADRANEVTVPVTGRDLLFFCSAFNEALNGIRKAAAGTGTGTNLHLARATHQRLRAIFCDVDLD
jgi:hypothetical protein